MKTTLVMMKISLIVKNLFDRKTGEELETIKAHFSDAYSDAQLCALVVIGMICRVFGLTPPQQRGTRSVWFVAGLFVQFLQSLNTPSETLARSAPTPLDIMIEDGLHEIERFSSEA